MGPVREISGSSSVWLERVIWDHEAGGSSPFYRTSITQNYLITTHTNNFGVVPDWQRVVFSLPITKYSSAGRAPALTRWEVIGSSPIVSSIKTHTAKLSNRGLWVQVPQKAAIAFLAELVYAFDLKSDYLYYVSCLYTGV